MPATDINIEETAIEDNDISPWNNLDEVSLNPHIRTFILPDDFCGQGDDELISPQPTRAITRTAGLQQRAVTDLIRLEIAQEELMNQIRRLESAHSQLAIARDELIQMLVGLDSGNVRQPAGLGLTQRSRGSEVEPTTRAYQVEGGDQESEAFYTFLSNRIPRQTERLAINRSQTLFDQTSDIHDSDMIDNFLDVNGTACLGFEDCITRAVGWAGDGENTFEYGLDSNGNDLEVDGPTTFVQSTHTR